MEQRNDNQVVEQEAPVVIATTEPAVELPTPELEEKPEEADAPSAGVGEAISAGPAGEPEAQPPEEPTVAEDAEPAFADSVSRKADSDDEKRSEGTVLPEEDALSNGKTPSSLLDGINDHLQNIVASTQSLAERMGAIEAAFPILRKDVLNLSKAVSGLYTTTTDRMHSKLEKFDRGLEQSIAKPYLRAIAKIGDSLRRAINAAEAEPETAFKQLQSLQDDIRVPLWNEGLRTIEIQPGTTPFNPRLHDGRDIVPTGNKALDGIIESVLETGYVFAPESDEPTERPRVFRAALVRVFRFDSALEPPAEEPTI